MRFTAAPLKANQIRAVLTVRVDDAVAFRDTCSLTSQRGRAKIIAALQAKGIAVDDGVLVILDEACRMPSRRPAAASATGSDATRTVPLPNLLGEIEAIVRRYVMIPADALTAVVLWIAHTYVLDAFDVTPYLNVTSPAKRCGKSRLLEVLESLVRGLISSVQIGRHNADGCVLEHGSPTRLARAQRRFELHALSNVHINRLQKGSGGLGSRHQRRRNVQPHRGAVRS